MKAKSILAALLLMVAGVQTADAQGFRVYKSDGTVMQFSFRTDSIVFYDGIGSDVDFGPFTPVNQMIVGTWYMSKTETVTFREDGTTDYREGATYKFFPYQGNIVIFSSSGSVINYFRVLELTAERMLVSTRSGSSVMVWSTTQPPQFVTRIILSETSIILQPDESKRLTASVYPPDADNMEVAWESSDETVAQVINNGLVVAVGNGTCVITCRATDGSGVYAECQVMVGKPIDVTCAEAVQLTNALADGATSTEIYAVTGYITAVVGFVYSGDNYQQQTFWMADTKNGGRVFEAYYANLPEGIEFGFEEGMKVKITGQLTKYVNNSGAVIPEIKNADVVILENGDGGGDNPDPGTDPVTDLVNGDFENWISDAEPVGWKSASSASNAELAKSTDAHDGSFACIVKAPGTMNKRLATQEITLEAGSYTFSFYAKSTTTDASQTRAGYVPVNADGSVGAYKYNSYYTDLSNTEWTQISFDFELTAQTTLCLIVMNPKNSSYSVSQDILIDDVTLTKK